MLVADPFLLEDFMIWDVAAPGDASLLPLAAWRRPGAPWRGGRASGADAL